MEHFGALKTTTSRSPPEFLSISDCFKKHLLVLSLSLLPIFPFAPFPFPLATFPFPLNLFPSLFQFIPFSLCPFHSPFFIFFLYFLFIPPNPIKGGGIRKIYTPVGCLTL